MLSCYCIYKICTSVVSLHNIGSARTVDCAISNSNRLRVDCGDRVDAAVGVIAVIGVGNSAARSCFVDT